MPIFDSEYPVPVTGTVTVDNFTTASFPAGFNVDITASIPLQVTASVPNLTASISNFPAFPAGYNVEITASIPLQVTASVPNLTASVSNFPAFPSGYETNITASITLPVSATNPVTASISNFPTGFNVEVTASVPLNVTSTQASPVWVTGAIDVINDLTGTVQVTGVVSVDNFPAFPSGYNSNITASITLPVSATNPVTASVANFPADQVVHGLVEITASVVIGVSQSNPVTSSVANWPTGFNANITASVPLFVTASVPNLTASISNFPAGFQTNITQSITLPVSATNPVTASIANFPTGFNVNLTGTVTVPVSATNPVTASIANVVTVTSTFPNLLNVKVIDSSGADLDLFKKNDNYAVGADHGLMILAVSDGTPQKYFPLRIEANDADGEAVYTEPAALATEAYGKLYNGTTFDRMRGDVSGTWVKTAAGTVLAVSQTNNPVTQSVTWAQGLPVTASIANFPTGQNVNITGSTVFLSSSIVGSTTASQTWVAAATSDTSLVASRTNRKGVTVYNSGTQALYLKLGTASSFTSFTVIMGTGTYYESPYGYTGPVNGIWAGATVAGSASLSEVY